MIFNGRLVESANIVAGIIPIDLAGQANNGDYVSLKNYERCAVVLYKAAGVAGDDPVFKLQQAQDVAGTGVKDLLFTDIYKKLGAQTGVGVFTKATQTAATSHTDAASAEAQAIFVIEVKASDLDVNNNFDCIRVEVADVGAGGAQIGCAFYILYNARSGGSVGLTAITD
jgi:hypothetical protein